MTNANRTEQVQRYSLDVELAQYDAFFDTEWAASMAAESASSLVADAVFNLTENWKTASCSARMPWLVVHCLGDFADRFTATNEPMLVAVLNSVSSGLGNSIDPPLTAAQVTGLRAHIAQAEQTITSARNSLPPPIDRQSAFADFMSTQEFALGVVGLMRLSYAAVYAGYEEFLVSCVRLLLRDQQIRASDRDFGRRTAEAFGDSLAQRFWRDGAVRLAREVRNALVHKGGRETPKLRERIIHTRLWMALCS